MASDEYNSHRSSGARYNAPSLLDKDNKFTSKDIVDPDSGKVLGGLLKVDPALATGFDAIYQRALPQIRKVIEKNVGSMAALVAERFAHMNPVQAKELGHKAADVAGYATIFWEDIAYGLNSTTKATGKMVELSRCVSPVLKANHETMSVSLTGGGTRNKMIAAAKSKIVHHYMHRVGTMIWDLPARIPQLWIKHLETKLNHIERAEELEKETQAGKPIEEKLKLMRARMEESRDTEGELRKLLKERKGKFRNEMLKDGYRPAPEEGNKKGGNNNNYNYGYNSDNNLRFIKDGHVHTWAKEEENLRKLWREAEKEIATAAKKTAETDKDKLTKQIQQQNQFLTEWGTIGGSLISSVASRWIDQEAAQRYSGATALEMVINLEEQIEGNPELKRQWLEHPDSVMIQDMSNGPLKGERVSLKKYIGEIFQRYRSDCKEYLGENKGRIGDRYFEKDEPMDMITNAIADALMHEKIHARAVMDLVGYDKLVKPNGLVFASEFQLKKAIEHEAEILPATTKVDMEQFAANATFTLNDLRAVFDKQKGVRGEERAFLAMTFPKEVLVKHGGLSSDDVDRLHKEIEGRFRRLMENAVCELAHMAAEEPDKFKALHVTPKEMTQLEQVSQGIASGDEKALDKAMGVGGLPGIEETVRNFAVRSLKEDGKFISKLTHSCRKNDLAKVPPASMVDRVTQAETQGAMNTLTP